MSTREHHNTLSRKSSMGFRAAFPCALLLPLLLLLLPVFSDASSRLYIVYMGEKKHDDPSMVTASHHDALTSVLGSKDGAMKSIVYSYKHGFSGFAAMLTESQAEELAKLPGVINVKPNTYHKVHTTRSWDFLGMNYYEQSSLLKKANYGEDIIVGVIDSGIWPESRSFDDNGYGPVPARWKGKCQTGAAFNATTCNRKIIGARWYSDSIPEEMLKGEYMSARDLDGHGTHTASTSRRSSVVPGTLHAVERGITVVFAGGNSGPTPYTIQNAVPWVITVAAATIDRTFPTVIMLGNNDKLMGQSLYYNSTSSSEFETLVDGCNNDTETNITGKIVLCSTPYQASTTAPPVLSLALMIVRFAKAGAKGLIFARYALNGMEYLNACNGIMACVLVDYEIARRITSYMRSQMTTAVVKVSPAVTMVGSGVPSPRVTAFSSRGPSTEFPGILKPDIAAPGASILAAVGDSYQFMSGTSMACPHVSAVAALLKSVHPNWSPSMIKSAIVTTASITDRFGMPIEAEGVPRKVADPFDFGGGHIEPDRAVDPGLVYDIEPREYTKFFNCTLRSFDDCESYMGQLYQLNLPSIAVPDLKNSVIVWRTVTNVGVAEASYHVRVEAPAGTIMSVEPSVIQFANNTRTATFKVTFTAKQRVQGRYTFGSLTWLDGNTHSVRIPIAVRTIIQDSVADTS
ncbi:hypothetical protein GUJ93_ZPchr0006g41530 [Zizania palustris]|uniref:Uncharacterized protein n=1 Tax=Zizania palustris TaxID=103762 RepID=A0A8J5VKE7_ZIZPA|nr:hypothetical protein GUJ93_ZPchr0006g41530 [Zizania palustris]